jgi:hypothetical protein
MAIKSIHKSRKQISNRNAKNNTINELILYKIQQISLKLHFPIKTSIVEKYNKQLYDN